MNAPTSFQAIPGQDELREVERDLRFHPSANDSPKVLTREQVAHFNKEGYVLPLRVFDAAEVGELRT